MLNEETREWLGLRLADLLAYLAVTAIIAMYFIDLPALEITLAVVALSLLLAACVLGMKSSPNVSRFTNVYKKLSYPMAFVMALPAIYFHDAGYYKIPQNGMYPSLPAGSGFFVQAGST